MCISLESRGITMENLVNKLFADDVYYSYYRLIETLVQYDDDVAKELGKVTRKTFVHMTDHCFSRIE